MFVGFATSTEKNTDFITKHFGLWVPDFGEKKEGSVIIYSTKMGKLLLWCIKCTLPLI
jgi:hypothetical protein